jgi:hypothetical protein
MSSTTPKSTIIKIGTNTINLHNNDNVFGIESDLASNDKHDDEYNAFIDGVESLVLAQFAAGYDVSSLPYQQCLVSVIEGGADRM